MIYDNSLRNKKNFLSRIRSVLRPPKKSGGLSPAGFTLVEVIVAMVILAMVVTGLLSVFLSAHRFVVRAKARLKAINKARYVAEILRNNVRKDKWDCVGNYPDCPLGLTAPEGQWIEGDFASNARYKVEKVGSNDHRKVTVEVTYQVPDL